MRTQAAGSGGAGLGRMEKGQGVSDLDHTHSVPGTQHHTDSCAECAE